MVTLLFTLLALNTTAEPTAVHLPSNESGDDFARNQIRAERSAPVPTNPLWFARNMTMDAVNELEEGFLKEYDERSLTFVTSYAGYVATAKYRFNHGYLAMVVINLYVEGMAAWDAYTACRDIVKHTSALAGQATNTTEILPWFDTLQQNVETHGIGYGLSNANHINQWLLEEGVLTVTDIRIGIATHVEINYIPRKPRN